MTTLDPRTERLQSFLDGELPADERAAFERELASDDALRDELAGLVELRALLTEAPTAFEGPLPGDLAFERVRRAIHAQVAAPGHADAAPAPDRKPADLRPRATNRQRRVVWGSAVAFAAAAAVFVVSFGVPSAPGPTTATLGPDRGHESVHDQDSALNGTEIVRVEFGKMSGTYWEQGDGGDRVAVVWIDDTFPGEVGRP